MHFLTILDYLLHWVSFAASVVIMEAVPHSRNLWTSSRVSLQVQYLGNKKSEGAP